MTETAETTETRSLTAALLTVRDVLRRRWVAAGVLLGLAAAAAVAAMTNSSMPAYKVGMRPRRSENSPAGICPMAMPTLKMPTIC